MKRASEGRGFSSRVPEPLTLAILLLVLAWIGGVAADQKRPPGAAPLGLVGLSRAFIAGMWDGDQLAFAFRIAGVLALGGALAEAPIVARALRRAAGLPRTYPGAVAATACASIGLAYVTWGLGLVGGAIFARAVSDRFRAKGAFVDDALVAAAGYAGFAAWHGGLSGSAPLAVAKPFDPSRPAPLAGLPTTETLFSVRNLATCVALFVAVPAFLWWRARVAEAKARADGSDKVGAASASAPTSVAAEASSRKEPERYGRAAALFLALSIVGGLATLVAARGVGAIDLDFILGASLVFGLLLHGSARAYAAAFDKAAPAAAGVLLQFPIYFGIAALARDSGLLAIVLDAFKAIVGGLSTLLPVESAASASTFTSAAVLNLFVPSGGGQWAVQGPVVAATARDLGVEPGRLVLAFAYGDQCTNMLQPFWALPVLAITRVRAGALLAKTAPLCALTAAIFLAAVVL
jgi:short-chain fatty acids transporter